MIRELHIQFLLWNEFIMNFSDYSVIFKESCYMKILYYMVLVNLGVKFLENKYSILP
jgi:hypothetical protein